MFKELRGRWRDDIPCRFLRALTPPCRYTARTPYRTPTSFPTQPAAAFKNPQLIEKVSTDTLFMIFYYHQGTYQQYLAARELKRQSWRYHKKYMTWFQVNGFCERFCGMVFVKPVVSRVARKC